MPTLPWQAAANPVVEGPPYVTMLTYLPLKHYRDTPRFLLYVVRVYLQLRRTKGVVGFSMRAKPLAKKYWTLSAWTSHEAMSQYIHTPPHLEVMRSMQGSMGQTAFTSWEVGASDLPLRWDDALARQTQPYTKH
jgi:heme-degrading monooxygenase HmoA